MSSSNQPMRAVRRTRSPRTLALTVILLALFGLHHLVAGQLEPAHSTAGTTLASSSTPVADVLVEGAPTDSAPLGLEHGGLLDDSGAIALCVALILAATVLTLGARHRLGRAMRTVRRMVQSRVLPSVSPVPPDPLFFTTAIIRC